MFPFRRIFAKESLNGKITGSPYLTPNGRKAAMRLIVNDAISVERLLNEIGSFHAAFEQIKSPSRRKSIDL